MKCLIATLFNKYRKEILYLVFGAVTTIINIAVYFVLYNCLHISNVTSTVIALIACVTVAYITNKLWVFESDATGFLPVMFEMFKFFLCRFLTGLLDVAIMYIFVDLLELNGNIMKIISNVAVIIINYVASKLIIFTKRAK